LKDFKEITSKENSLIKLTSGLQNSSKARYSSKRFCLEGLRTCSDAFLNGIRFDKLIVSKTGFEKFETEIDKFSEVSEECYILPDLLFKKISDTDSPQGILAICEMPLGVHKIKKSGRYIGLENIQDPSNLGAVARSCEALGADGILLSKNGCDPFSPKSLRASMGTLLRIPVIIFDDFITEVKKCGLSTYACVVDSDALPINSINFCEGSIVLIGNEANGLTDEMKSMADFRVTIPMKGNAESLNAAVAASIAIWEMVK